MKLIGIKLRILTLSLSLYASRDHSFRCPTFWSLEITCPFLQVIQNKLSPPFFYPSSLFMMHGKWMTGLDWMDPKSGIQRPMKYAEWKEWFHMTHLLLSLQFIHTFPFISSSAPHCFWNLHLNPWSLIQVWQYSWRKEILQWLSHSLRSILFVCR